MERVTYPPYERTVVASTDLSFRRSVDLLGGVQQHDYVELLECGKFTTTNNEYLLIQLEVNVPQHPENDIRGIEIILIEVIASDEKLPWVYSVRDDFPVVSHLNLMYFELPRSLCLYDQPSDSVKLSWSGFSFIERIREWLTLTAEGKLHHEDQPLEPFIISSNGNLILPKPPYSSDLKILETDRIEGKLYNYRSIEEKLIPNNHGKTNFCLLPIEAGDVVHGHINAAPKNLYDLYGLLKRLGIDLIDRLLELYEDEQKRTTNVLLFLTVRQKREENTKAERVSKYTFAFHDSLQEVLSNIGLLEVVDTGSGKKVLIDSFTSIFDPKEKEKLKKEAIEKSQSVSVYILTPHFAFTKSLARKLTGLVTKKTITISQVGVGALGSPIALNLARSGFGEQYYVFDHDTLLPHNLSRHILGDRYVGYFKSKAVAMEMNQVVSDWNYAKGLVEMVKSDMSDEIKKVIFDSDLIIDSSASVPVSRLISQMGDSKNKVISVFFNPSGSDLVILASGKGISTTQLEMLYYAHIVIEEQLQNHLLSKNGRIRYSGGCSDITSVLSNETVSIHAGVATGAIKKVYNDILPFAAVWICSNDYTIKKVEIPVFPFQEIALRDWKLFVSEKVLRILNETRKSKLPNETGGVLIGSYDTEWKELYVVDTIVSPKDSTETSTSYIRGIDGVEEKILKIEKKTLYNLTYLGEWHTHPDGSSTNMSEDDKIQLEWIQEVVLGKGYPGVMLIIGEKDISYYC
jgi:hypothetical protein